MPTPEARRSPRVPYHAAVALLAPSDQGDEPRTLAAEALDLGEGGMRLAVSERIPIGAALTCQLTLDGRATALHGRVVWLRAHTSPTPHGMGVRFDELSSYDQRLLADVIERSSAGYRPVQLHFERASAPIVARALTHTAGLTLSAPLPILDRGASVEVRFDEESAALRGRVDDVRVVETDQRRRLEVEIVLGDADGARFRREARYASAGTLGAVPRLVDSDALPATAEAPTGRTGRARAAAGLLAALAVGVAAGLAAAPVVPVPPAPALNATAPAPTPTAVEPMPAPVAPAPPAPQVAALTTPSIAIEGRATVLRLPFSGSLEGMVARTWAMPAALALDLPGGRVELGSGSHALQGGSVAGLRVNARHGASLLRVRLAEPIGRYAVSAHDGQLELRLFATE